MAGYRPVPDDRMDERGRMMVRVVDVQTALAAVPYEGVDEASVALSVADEHAQWNDGTFAVEGRDGRATVDATADDPDATADDPDATADDPDATDDDPDATVGAGALSRLYMGSLSVARVRAVSGLAVTDPSVADALAALFPQREASVPESF
jgi:hypothetical protein